jgi:phosphoenolpyruvate carboxykinase (GTP)
MLPFCGYNMADYLGHWLDIGKSDKADPSKLPRIYKVNWFRKSPTGKWLWPGFGENSRVIAWIVDRVSGRGEAVETPIGNLPAAGAINTDGLDVSAADMEELLYVDNGEWQKEIPLIEEHYESLGERVPQALRDELTALDERLKA